MSTKMLLHGDDIRMTMMLMNMIMTTMLVFTRRRRRHNLFLNGFIYTYIAVAVQPGPSGRWADAAAACLLRLMQPLRRPWCMRYIVGLIQTGLMRNWLYSPCRALPRPEARPNVGATPVAGMLAIACWHVVVLSKLGGSHDMVQPAG